MYLWDDPHDIGAGRRCPRNDGADLDRDDTRRGDVRTPSHAIARICRRCRDHRHACGCPGHADRAVVQAPTANEEPPILPVVPVSGRFDFTKASVAILVELSLAACVIAVAPFALPPMELAGMVFDGKLTSTFPPSSSRRQSSWTYSFPNASNQYRLYTKEEQLMR